ncbi:thioredoxin-like [Thalassophryne amazonica]|uniref:thioredoxin-like n=1 Tax=Thalassophryne amazonica TaxID=390379 RepID=UPI0014709529|nr:thioredoxin-like [Thalassophryne amazonica]
MVRVIESLEEFEAVLKENELVVVDFTATWCGPCKMIAPQFEALSKMPENSKVVFLKVDVDDVEEVSQKCNISCMPTFQFYKNGKKVDEFSGANVDSLKEKIAALRS